MPTLTTFTASLREFFTLTRADRVVRAYAPDQHARVRRYVDAGDRRLSAGRRVPQPVPSCVLLRDALACYQAAAAIARDAAARDDAPAGDRVTAFPPLPADPSRPRASPTDDERVREAVTSADRLYFDRLELEDAWRARAALDRAASALRSRIETRSLANLRATRWGRWLAGALVVGYALVSSVLARVLPVNVALDKPVFPSSVRSTPAAGQSLVDGDTGTSWGVYTQIEDSPHVVIDLLGAYRIDHIDVHNRVDGWFDDCLPLVVELSLDGKTFTPLARRTEHFEGNPPWVIRAHGARARYVRVRAERRTYLALSEVEVYAKR